MQSYSSLFAATLVLAAPITLAAPSQGAADSRIAVPTVQYESAFSGYSSRTEIERKSWQDANAEVVGGGHAGHGAMDHSMHDAAPAADNNKQPDAHRH